ncbi:hypothetical protein A5724_32105 [Mycobacterium sp. ACS1612]|nr:hypothetical protein A5724_32105 [Mycobacterium sp. ACS1612]
MNRLPPVGLMLFSVGAVGGVLDGVVLVVVVVTLVDVVAGPWLSLVPHAAAVAMIAAPPMTTTTGCPIRLEVNVLLLSELATRR